VKLEDIWSYLIMDSGLVLTVADLRGRAIVDWEQDVELSFAYKRSPPMIVKLVPDLVVPKAVFKYQLHQAFVEGTANGGVRWWCDVNLGVRIQNFIQCQRQTDQSHRGKGIV
jgi:hypothetical protein